MASAANRREYPPKAPIPRDGARKEEWVREIGRIVEGMGYECVHVGMGSDSGSPVMRVFIDSLGGIDVSDCERVSKAVNRFLDARDDPELGGRYYLEVSSPGLERPLFEPKDYARFGGKQARIRTHQPLDGRKTFTGVIGPSDETSVTLMTDEGERIVRFDEIARAKLVFEGLEAQKPKRHKPVTDNRKKHEEEH